MDTVFNLMDKKITALEPQKRNPNRFNVFLDDEFAFGVSRFVGAWLEVGQSIPEEKIVQLTREDERERALQIAFRYIGYQPRTESEIRGKLVTSDFSEMLIDDVISELKDKEYLNDCSFAKQWMESRSESKPRSRYMLSLELKRKGVDEKIISSVLESIPEDIELAMKLGKKYIRKFSNLSDVDFKKKLSGVLSRKGFSYSITKEIIFQLLKLRKMEKEK